MLGRILMRSALLTNFVLAVLATYRLAQLVSLDDGPLDCFATLRGLTAYNLKGKQREGPIWKSLEELMDCPYCLGVWFAGLMTLLVVQIAPMNLWTGLLFWLGVAGGQCALQSSTDVSRR